MRFRIRGKARRVDPREHPWRSAMKGRANGGINSLLGQGSRFEGTAKVEGTARVDGLWEGSLEVSDTLVVGKTGELTGDVRARHVVVSGRVVGTITATECVELQRGCRLEGDVRTRTFVVEDGVFFEGSCRMSEEAPAGAGEEVGAETERVGPGPRVVLPANL
jgi:cytoskeletal protein CcmA (bactofilin family)